MGKNTVECKRRGRFVKKMEKKTRIAVLHSPRTDNRNRSSHDAEPSQLPDIADSDSTPSWKNRASYCQSLQSSALLNSAIELNNFALLRKEGSGRCSALKGRDRAIVNQTRLCVGISVLSRSL